MCTIRILAMVMKFTFQQESGLKSHFGFSRFRSNFFIFDTKKTLCWSSIPGTLTGVRVLGIEACKENNKRAENEKLVAACSSTGNNYFVCSKSCGGLPGHVITTGNHPQ